MQIYLSFFAAVELSYGEIFCNECATYIYDKEIDDFRVQHRRQCLDFLGRILKPVTRLAHLQFEANKCETQI